MKGYQTHTQINTDTHTDKHRHTHTLTHKRENAGEKLSNHIEASGAHISSDYRDQQEHSEIQANPSTFSFGGNPDSLRVWNHSGKAEHAAQMSL